LPQGCCDQQVFRNHTPLIILYFDLGVREQLFNGVRAVSDGIARTYGMPEDKLPTIVRKGFSSPLVNSIPAMERIDAALMDSGVVDEEKLITKFRAITGSEDMHMLVHDLEGVNVAYLVVGTAAPAFVAKAKAEGKSLPFSNHQPDYQVDLNAIPFGSKVGGIIVMDLLAKGGTK